MQEVLQAVGCNNSEISKALVDVQDWIEERITIDPKLFFAHMIGQTAAETSSYHFLEENLNYSAKGLRRVWPRHFPDDEHANKYAHNPEKIANYVYASRLGNNQPGDGWKYRGRGFIQTTGRYNYQKLANYLGYDFLECPNLLLDHQIAWKAAAYYLIDRSLSYIAEDNVKRVTRSVNGGFHGLERREKYTNIAKEYLS